MPVRVTGEGAMKREELCALERALKCVPQGTVQVDGSRLPEGDSSAEPLLAETDGQGRMELWRVFPGVTAAFNRFLGSRAVFRHREDPAVLELHYCRLGRIGWEMRNGTSVYLGAGDLTAHSMSCCADSVMTFPVGFLEGLSLAVDLERLEADCPEILREAGLRPENLRERFCRGTPTAIPACEELSCVFTPLWTAPERLRLSYLRLKVQELLLYLEARPAGGRELTPYVSQQTELIRRIHRTLTERLDRRYTIEELSRLYLINSSSLKELFKAVYGQPIATYMKEYRIHWAMELLRDTSESVADIAAQVGYETQGKFSQAFKDITGTVPTVYRRQCRSR